jgi:hypothetical protein
MTSYILLNVDNRRVKINYAGHHGLMIRQDGNILETDKAGGIILRIVDISNYIENFFFHYYRNYWYSFIGTGRWGR